MVVKNLIVDITDEKQNSFNKSMLVGIIACTVCLIIEKKRIDILEKEVKALKTAKEE